MSKVRKQVYEIVKKSPQPIDPENIAKEVGIGWGTALRYALELVVVGKVRGLKTTKSWVFWVESPRPKEEGKGHDG